jgi:predicted Kef-type K+ transport protein
MRRREQDKMYEAQYFTDVLWFLFAAVLVSAISARLKSSPVLGYLVAGVAMGPWALNLIQNVENSRSISELGLVFLFFAIGLGMSLERLLILNITSFPNDVRVDGCVIFVRSSFDDVRHYRKQFGVIIYGDRFTIIV